MGQAVSNIVRSISTSSSDQEDDDDAIAARWSDKCDHEETSSSSSSLQQHPFSVLFTTTDHDDHPSYYSHDQTTASILKRVITIPNYNFVATASTVTHLSSSPLHPFSVLLTSATNDHHINIITQNGITSTTETSCDHSHHGDGAATLLMVSQQPQSSQKEDETVIENVADDDHQINTQDNGVGGAKQVVENDDIDKKLIIIKTTCNKQKIKERVIKHYSNRHKILLVGEGDFSFSACLARYFCSGINMVATSFDYKDMLLEKHWSAEAHVEELRRLGCKVLHGVDVHVMYSNRRLKGMRFDRIVYNFPHAGHFPYYGELDLIEMHQELLLGFFKSASKMLVDEGGGEIHVSHRDDPPYDQWEIVKLAKKAGLALIEKVGFEKKDYPGWVSYITREVVESRVTKHFLWDTTLLPSNSSSPHEINYVLHMEAQAS